MKILLVDDDIMSLKITIQLLELEGYFIWFALNGQDALELLDEEKFDMIILDLFMPEMGGMELLKVLREERKNKVPIIILSRTHAQEDVNSALECGANDFISKPFEPEQLIETVKKHLP